MLKIEKCVVPSPEQWEIIIEGARNAKNSWHLMDSGLYLKDTYEGDVEIYEWKIGPNDEKLMKSLAKGGPVHAKYRRMIPVFMTITANQVWWQEADTYKIGCTRNSCSKMHKIHVAPFVIDNFSHEGCDEVPEAKEALEYIIKKCEWLRQKFNETKEKKYWRALIELLPEGFNLKATIALNYEVLHNIYFSRENHKMFEWDILRKFIETLPYSEIITTPMKNSNIEIEDAIKVLQDAGYFVATSKEDLFCYFCTNKDKECSNCVGHDCFSEFDESMLENIQEDTK